MLIGMVNKYVYVQFVHNLFIAILQYLLSRNIKVRLRVGLAVVFVYKTLAYQLVKYFVIYALSLLVCIK